MQDKGFLAFLGSTNNPVQILVIPILQHVRFTLGQIATHREPCFRQIQGVLVVTHRFSVPFFGWIPGVVTRLSVQV